MDNKKEKLGYRYVIKLAWELGYIIALPLVAFALIGRFLDKKLGTAPWLLIAGILISIAISSYIVYKKVKEIL